MEVQERLRAIRKPKSKNVKSLASPAHRVIDLPDECRINSAVSER